MAMLEEKKKGVLLKAAKKEAVKAKSAAYKGKETQAEEDAEEKAEEAAEGEEENGEGGPGYASSRLGLGSQSKKFKKLKKFSSAISARGK